MSNRINFTAWGNTKGLTIPAYAMADPDEIDSPAARVASSIARKNGLEEVTLRSDGTALSKGKPESHHYQTTLGKPCPGGGWTPEAELWFSIPVEVDHA